MKAMQSKQRLWHGLPRAFWYLWIGTLLNRLGGFVSTFLALYLTEKRGFSAAESGLVVSFYGAGSLCAGPIGGTLADRIGRRTTLLVGLLGAAVAMVNLGLSRGYLRLCVGALALGCLNDLGRPAVQAAIADLVRPEDRARAYGLLYWAINLGFAGAAMLAGFLAKLDFLLLFIGDATTTTLFGLIVLLRVPETLPVGNGSGKMPTPLADFLAPYRDTVFATFLLIQFAVGWVFCQSVVSLPLDMSQHGISMPRYGQLIAINGILIVLLQPIAVKQVARFRRSQVLAVAALLTGGGFGLCALGHSEGFYAASIGVWTIGEIIFSPVVPTLIADLAPRELRGSYQGSYQLSWGAAILFGPALGGVILGRLGSRWLWTFCFGVGLAAAWLHLRSAAARRRRLRALPDAEAALTREDPIEN